jgi:Zn-dependent peptidase ImmA (M78 family)
VRWVRDETGRLPLRPHFRPDEIDAECERLVASFLRQRQGADASPLSTDDLTVLLEQETDDLDLYADLSAEGADTEGVTDFFPGQRPRVRIAARLSESRRREHRLRTTLAHELGHVRLHDCLWTLDPRSPAPLNPRCRREGIERPAATDWLEWQAGYACGALLMPAGAVSRLVDDLLQRAGRRPPLLASGTLAGTLERRVARTFDVSLPAARTRLFKLGHLTAYAGAPLATRAPLHTGPLWRARPPYRAGPPLQAGAPVRAGGR